MDRNKLPNISLIALAASFLLQIGAGFFALAVVARVLTAAPPRSLSMLQGPYGYNSSTFWQIAPAITGVFFVAALITNWRTSRRTLLLIAFSIFALGGIVTGAFLAPLFSEIAAVGYSDLVDAALQERATLWYNADWSVRCAELLAGLLLLVALSRPPVARV